MKTRLHYLIIAVLICFSLNGQVFVTGGGVGGWDQNGKVFLTSTDGVNYSSTASFEVTGDMKIGDAPGWANIRGYDDTKGSGWPGGTLPNTCGDCGKDIKPAANGWYNVTYNINTKEYLFTAGVNPYGPYPTLSPSAPMTFEESQTSIYYKFEDFGNINDSEPKGGLTKIENPHKEGINTSNTVFQMIKRGWASWSGSKFFTAPTIDFSVNKIIKVKIWSPRVGAILHLKFEGGGGDDGLYVSSTVANAWEELIFDFSAVTMGTSRTDIVFQFEDGLNNGYDPITPAQSNVADYTWLIDDISLTSTLSTENFDRLKVNMFPNPVKNTLTIETNSTIQKVSFYNVLGQEVLTTSPKNNSATIQTSELKRGVYIVKTDVDGVISTSKILKE
jgi:hypothetical protein